MCVIWIFFSNFVTCTICSISISINYNKMVHRIHLAELKLIKANSSDTEVVLLANFSVSNDIVSTKIYDKQGDFEFDMINFSFFDGDAPQRISSCFHISQFICLARPSSHVSYFNSRTKFLTTKLLKQCYRYHKLRKAFSKLYVDTMN